MENPAFLRAVLWEWGAAVVGILSGAGQTRGMGQRVAPIPHTWATCQLRVYVGKVSGSYLPDE